MIRWLITLLYGSVPAEFPSSFTMQESVARLKTATARSFFPSLSKQSAAGTVSEKRVSLQRIIPMFRNSFKPFFIGRFEFKNGRVVLVGRFTMLWFIKAFMTFWLGFNVLWTAMTAFAVATHKGTQWWFPLFGVGMFCSGITFVRGCQWLSRNDISWLSRLITSTLSGDCAGVPPTD